MFHQPWDSGKDTDYEPIFGSVFLELNIAVRSFKSYRLLSRLSLLCKRKVAACVLLIFKFLLARPFKNDNRRRTYFIMFLQPLMAIIIVFDFYWHLTSSMLVEVGYLSRSSLQLFTNVDHYRFGQHVLKHFGGPCAYLISLILGEVIMMFRMTYGPLAKPSLWSHYWASFSSPGMSSSDNCNPRTKRRYNVRTLKVKQQVLLRLQFVR